MRVLLLGVLVGTLIAQAPPKEKWVPLESPSPPICTVTLGLEKDKVDCPKPTLRFWRLRMESPDKGKGLWHLYNPEDDQKFLGEVSAGKWGAWIEWFALEGRLPK